MDITVEILWWAFGISVVFGAVASKTQFCPLGGISMLVNEGDAGRLYAWLYAGTVALIGILALEFFGLVSIDSTIPPYRMSNFMWPRYILGGILFGVGMTLCAGCGMRNLIRLGGGNLKAIVVILSMGIMGFIMARTDFFYYAFSQWMAPMSIDFADQGIEYQDWGSLLSGWSGVAEVDTWRLGVGLAIILVMTVLAFRSKTFRANPNYPASAFILGGLIVLAYYITGGPMGEEWIEAADFMDEPPAMVGTQSYTFIAPMGDYLFWLQNPGKTSAITFGIAAITGVGMGAFLFALISGGINREWFSSPGEALRYIIGGAMVGTGGVLGMGCTLGQGIAGVGTLAIGSYLALISIIIGAGASIRVQHRMAGGASFMKALPAGVMDVFKSRQRLE